MRLPHTRAFAAVQSPGCLLSLTPSSNRTLLVSTGTYVHRKPSTILVAPGVLPHFVSAHCSTRPNNQPTAEPAVSIGWHMLSTSSGLRVISHEERASFFSFLFFFAVFDAAIPSRSKPASIACVIRMAIRKSGLLFANCIQTLTIAFSFPLLSSWLKRLRKKPRKMARKRRNG